MAGPGCTFPANHCLPADILFVDESEYNGNYSIAYAAKQTVAPGPTGEATFVRSKDGAEVITKFVYASRPAGASDLHIGRLALASPHKEEGVIRSPRTTEDALKGQWLVVRILDVSSIGQGYVLTTGNRRVAIDGMRVMDADASATLNVASDVDKHFLSSSHYHIAKKPLPEKGYDLIHVGLAIAPPAATRQGEGHYYNAKTGRPLWTAHAWLSRPATQQDLTVGRHVIYASKRKGGLHVPVASRQESLHQQWYVAKLVDTSQLYKGVVTTSQGHDVSLEALRVLR